MKTCISPIYGKGQQVRSYSTEWTTPKRDIQCSISEEMRYEQIMDGLYIVAQNKKCNRLFKRVLRFLNGFAKCARCQFIQKGDL